MFTDFRFLRWQIRKILFRFLAALASFDKVAELIEDQADATYRCDMNDMQKAESDLFWMRKVVKYAANRRSVPEWTVPAEVVKILLMPDYVHRSSHRRGDRSRDRNRRRRRRRGGLRCELRKLRNLRSWRLDI